MPAMLRTMPTPSNAEQSERRVTLRSPFGRSEFSCRSGEPILYAGLRHGLNLPYECATGTCGVCRLVGAPSDVRLIWTEAPGRSRLKADRELLLCQSVARRDCEIESNVPLPPWPAGRPRPDYYQGRVTSRRLLARDVLAFTIALDRPMAFEPGQFALLRAPEFAGYRTYSMINTDAPARELSFVIKRKVGGAASGWLFESAGDRPAVELFGPLGRAVLGADEDAHLLIIAGGTGIAGPLAILRGAAARNLFSTRRAVVLFGSSARWPTHSFSSRLRIWQIGGRSG